MYIFEPKVLVYDASGLSARIPSITELGKAQGMPAGYMALESSTLAPDRQFLFRRNVLGNGFAVQAIRRLVAGLLHSVDLCPDLLAKRRPSPWSKISFRNPLRPGALDTLREAAGNIAYNFRDLIGGWDTFAITNGCAEAVTGPDPVRPRRSRYNAAIGEQSGIHASKGGPENGAPG